MKTVNPAEVSAAGFSMTAELNPKRNLVMQTHMAADAPVAEMYALLDKFCTLADTLDTRYRLVDMKLILEKQREELPIHERKMKEYEEDVVRKHQTSGKRGDFRWDGQHKTNRDNMAMNVAAARENVKRTEKAIKEAELELAEMKNAASGATDRQSGAADR